MKLNYDTLMILCLIIVQYSTKESYIQQRELQVFQGRRLDFSSIFMLSIRGAGKKKSTWIIYLFIFLISPDLRHKASTEIIRKHEALCCLRFKLDNYLNHGRKVRE